jgi:hypothetical protein
MSRSLSELSPDLVSPYVFADLPRIEGTFARLRAESPVHWTDVEGYRPFWSVTKHADIVEIEKQNDLFINDPRLTIQDAKTEERLAELTGGKRVLRSLVDMDNPDHRKYRGLTQSWFMGPNLRKLEDPISALAEEFIDRMEANGKEGELDFVNDVAVWYPLRAIMMILGVPQEDEALMLKLTQELFGATDPDMVRDDASTNDLGALSDFYNYFNAVTADRRANPRDDLASIIANAQIDGEPIGELEAISYYVIVATAGHDTTSSSTAGGLLALIQNPDQLAKLRGNPDLLPKAIDEMVRWVTPVKHFFRTATEDYVLRGQQIKAGQNLAMWYASGNRDEDVYDDPFSFRIDRHPNPHLAFGFGAHHCIGNLFAKMEMRALFSELLSRVESLELAGEPAWVKATFVSGLKTLPIRYKFK